MTTLNEQPAHEMGKTWTDGGRDPLTGRLLPGHKINRGRRSGSDRVTDDDVDLAMRTYRDCLNDSKASWRDRLHAADAVMERRFGKAAAADLTDRIDGMDEKIESIAALVTERLEHAA